MKKYVYKCRECGSENIQILAWINPNTDEIIDDNGDSMCWCESCKCEQKFDCIEQSEQDEENTESVGTDLERAIRYVRKNMDMEFVNYCVNKSLERRCPLSVAFPAVADHISDLLEEYGQDNNLPGGWWYEYDDIDEIACML